MYKKTGAQMSFYDYVMPFEGVLDEHNRWVRLAGEIDWFALEDQYSRRFQKKGGQKALPVRVAFGSLIIREALGVSDAETLRLITESPYLQYFIGQTEFSSEPPFSVRSLGAFRQRFDPELVEATVQRVRALSKEKR